ncbi:MAG: glycosyltransferase family 2 protein [Conexivisphaerales archaeon]
MSLLGYLVIFLGGLLAVYSLYWGFLLVVGGDYIRKFRQREVKLDKPFYLPFVSVIVAAKNEEKVIRRLVSSLQTLNYDPSRLEFIFSESGSTDNTRSILFALAEREPRMKVVTSSIAGKGNALNEAIKVARGEVFFFLDADCVPEKDFLLKAAEEYNKGNKILVGYYRTINATQSIWSRLAVFEDFLWRVMGAGKAKLNLSIPVAGPCTVISRDAIEAVGGFRNTLTEDIELWMRLLKAGYVGKYVDAYVWLEAPVTLQVLLRQRIRWYRGYLETALMHLDIVKHAPLSQAADALLMLSTPFFAMLSLLSYAVSMLSLPALPTNISILLFVGWFIGSNLLGLFLLNIGVMFILGNDGSELARMSPLVYLYTAVLSLSSSIAILNMAFSRPRKWIKTERTGYVDPIFAKLRR